jgi:hypothetical protein
MSRGSGGSLVALSIALQQTLSRRAPDGILHTDVMRALTASRLFEGALRLM